MEVEIIEDASTETDDQKALDVIINIVRYAATEKKVKASEILKRLFNKTSTVTLQNKIYHRLTLSALLENLEDSQKNSKAYRGKYEFLLQYSNSILNYISFSDNVSPQLLSQLEWIYSHLLNNNSQYLKRFVRNIWESLESKSAECIPLFNLILTSSTFYVEEIIFKQLKQIFIDEISIFDVNIKHIVRLSGHLPALFKMITLILNQFIIMTHYKDKMMQFLNYYIKDLFQFCDESGLNILSLYPKDCCRLVSLLRIPVEMLHSGLVNRNNVCEVLWENFITDRGKVLMLLSHFPNWFEVFLEYVESKSEI